MKEVVLSVDDLQSTLCTAHCRICHEEEFESRKSLEAPCACSGTVKVLYQRRNQDDAVFPAFRF